MAQDLPAGTVTFVMTDVEGSTRLWERDPEAMQRAIARHDALITAAIAQHGGSLVKSRGEGDSLFAIFSDPVEAVAAASTAQQLLTKEAWSTTGPLRVRVAAHTGEANLREDDYYGPSVNRCARLRSIGHGGQVLVSEATAQVVRDKLPEGTSLHDMGAHRLKDLIKPERVYQLLAPGLERHFPPLRSLDALQHNLPIQVTNFVGRERALDKLQHLLDDTRLITLSGFGGVGKTRLALQLAAAVVDKYENGAWLVELASVTDPTVVPQSVASVFSLQEDPGRNMTQILADTLRARRLLLILDNCEHVLDACAELTNTLLRNCAGICVVATSRERLGIEGERVWHVPPLSLPSESGANSIAKLMQSEAVRLFLERAADALPEFKLTEKNGAAVAEVCRRLDGVPLALGLAAARVRILSVEQIATRLEDRFRLLTGGSRTVLPRQQTLRAAIDWSYDLLEEPEQQLLRRLAVFSGGWTLAAAEAVCGSDGIDEADVLDLLTRLVDKSLVVAEKLNSETRYRMLETIHEYAGEKLASAGELPNTSIRHLNWCISQAQHALARLFGPHQHIWLERLHQDHDNFRRALLWAERSNNVGHRVQLALALWQFWRVRGHLSEGRMWLQPARDPSIQIPDGLRGNALIAAGALAYTQGDYVEAQKMLERGLEICERQADIAGVGLGLQYLGLVHRAEGEYAPARSLLSRSLRLRQQVGDDVQIADCLRCLGLVEEDLGNFSAALKLFEESLALRRVIGDKSGVANSLTSVGYVMVGLGDYQQARRYSQESLAICRELKDGRGIGLALYDLGLIATADHKYGEALDLLRESLRFRRDLGEKEGQTECVMALAAVAAAQGQYEHAATLLGGVEGLRAAISAPTPPSLNTLHSARLHEVEAQILDGELSHAHLRGRQMSAEELFAIAMSGPSA